ncbi:L-amino-acid oxidase-like [Haliotis rubra]|uniref:L-amino-acid oxidase-like n=1 Tax=Haliotis rubra TaxID=36100 RepID=UPI001EE5EB08|nr:L-amino-acid oxidase-like [Haliotis rubra]
MTSNGNFLERRVGLCRMIDVLMTSIIVVSSLIIAILIATAPGTSDADCLDIAVIGGGIGGAYTGWRLRDRDLSISVFEYSDRVGGRLFTTDFPAAPGTYLDFGGMRFRANAHPTLNRTATEIGLKIVTFALGYGNADETIWYTRGKHMRNTDLGTSRTPYSLALQEMKTPGALIWSLFKNNVNYSKNTYPSLDELYNMTTVDGTPLYKMTLDNFYGRFASREAYKYIYDLEGWAGTVGRQGALHSPKATASYPGDTGPSEEFKTIDGGMGKVPQALMEKFLNASTSHKLHLNHQLLKIERRQSGGYNLRFRKTHTTDGITTQKQFSTDVTVCARKVVLAAQQRCIQEIDIPMFKSNPDIVKNLDSVVGIPAGRIYLAYNTKWWKNGNPDITHTKSDQLNRQTYDWSTGTNNVSIIMASYHDGDLAHYWRELSQFGTPIPGSLPGVNAVTDVVKNRAEKFLSAIYNVSQSDIPEAVGGAMMMWDKYPFYAAWDYFKPGFDERTVRDLVYKPSVSDHIYIASNSWAPRNLQEWCEGTLIAVDAVINRYFKDSN